MTDPETFSVYEPSPSTQAPADLDEQKFTHLNALLDQTTIYSKFLSEQMEGLDEEKDAERARKKQKKSAKDAPGAKGKKAGGRPRAANTKRS
jgi:hypothetical protein